jgi:GGDEF domain-containing protein
MLLLPECDSGQLQHVLQRLVRFKVAIDKENIPVEFSAGWKEFEQGQSSESLLSAADRALYENKRASHMPVVPQTSNV